MLTSDSAVASTVDSVTTASTSATCSDHHHRSRRPLPSTTIHQYNCNSSFISKKVYPSTPNSTTMSSSLSFCQVFLVTLFIAAHCIALASGRRSGRIHYKTTYACEGKQLDLSCSDGQIIHLVRANYGRFSLSICNPTGQIDLSVNCMSYRSFLIMQDKCSQSSNCSIVVSSKIFGDPCPGTSKYLEVQYHCAHPQSADSVAIESNGANSGASTATNAPVIITTRKPATSGDRESDSNSNTGPSFNIESGGSTNLSPQLKPPYENSPVIRPNLGGIGGGGINGTSAASPTTMTTTTTGGSIGRLVTPTNLPSTAIPVTGIPAVVTFRPNSGGGDSSGKNEHPFISSGKPAMNRPSVPLYPTEILPKTILKNPPPPVPETSLPPWLTAASGGSGHGVENNNGESSKTNALDDLFNNSNLDHTSDSESSGNSSVTEEEDDDMILMAIALFFIVFFLVLATFGLIYCILRSDHVRSRKLVSRIPFVTCLFGPDISSDVEVEKVSSVVQSSAYGTTSGTSGPVSFPIIATRVPTQITSTSATGSESPASSASSLNVKGGGPASLGVSPGSNQPQLTSPSYPQGCNWYQASPLTGASGSKKSTSNSFMTSNLRFMGREAMSIVPSYGHLTSDELTSSTVASSMPLTSAEHQQHSTTTTTCSSFNSSSNNNNSNSSSSSFNTTATASTNSSMSQLLLLNNCVNFSADCKPSSHTFASSSGHFGGGKVNTALIDPDTGTGDCAIDANDDDDAVDTNCELLVDQKHVISSSSSSSHNSPAVLVTGKSTNGSNSGYHYTADASVVDDASLISGPANAGHLALGQLGQLASNGGHGNNGSRFLFTSSLYRAPKGNSKSNSRTSALRSQAKNLITNPWELLMGNSSNSSSPSSSSTGGVSRSSTGHLAFESVNPRYTSRPEILLHHQASPLHQHLKYSHHANRSQLAGSSLLLNITGHPSLSQRGQGGQHHLSHLHLASSANSEHVYESIDTDSLSNFNIHEYQQRLAMTQQHHQPQQLHSASTSSSSRSLIPSDPRILNV